MQQKITDHYTPGNLMTVIDQGLKILIGGQRAVTVDDLAPVDEFHIGGRGASVHLFEQLNVSSDDHVLDIGAGIGGTARFVAHSYGARVKGIDLTPEFCEVAGKLTELVGMEEKVSVQHGSAMKMPFESDSFSVAYMMHVGMNIEDKIGLYAEVNRVLKPGGTFAIYDVLLGPNRADFRFPVPWASSADSSYLATPEEMRSMLKAGGFTVESTTDRTKFATDFFATTLAASPDGPPPIGLHLILGKDARLMLENMATNINDGRCGPWELIARKSD